MPVSSHIPVLRDSRTRRRAGAARSACVAALALACAVAPARAQQFVTDDAAVVDFRSCQVEAWHGERSSWILPACAPISDLELTAGVGWVAEDGGRSAEYVVQGKFLLRAMDGSRPGIGLVAGLGLGPLPQVAGDAVSGAFAYVPVSVALGEGRVVLHGNLGWLVERDAHEHDGVPHEESHHALTWAARADLLLPVAGERLTAIGEIFGENGVRPEFQLGLRATLVADRLLADLSWGGHTARGFRGPGWTVGLAWTPPSFF